MAVKMLAATLGVSRATVQTRIFRLKASGAIRGFTVELGVPVEENSVRAMMNVATDHARPDQSDAGLLIASRKKSWTFYSKLQRRTALSASAI